MSIWGTIRPQITSLRQAMDRHLSDASRGELLRDGLRIAIVGRPNGVNPASSTYWLEGMLPS